MKGKYKIDKMQLGHDKLVDKVHRYLSNRNDLGIESVLKQHD